MKKANWTEEEIDELKENISGLASDLNIDDPEWEEMLLRRTLDIRDAPEKFLTIDEFIEKCESSIGKEALEEGRKWVREKFYGEREEGEESNGSGSEAS